MEAYVKTLKKRLRILWLVLVCFIVYMVTITAVGGGDSRVMDGAADLVSKVIFFGGLGYVIYRISYYNYLLKINVPQMDDAALEEDEKRKYLHHKSGGTGMDVLMIFLLFSTCTAALFHMTVFYISLSLLAAAIIVKRWLRHKHRKAVEE